jgi:4-amino-4-deoxy-L-arabinose transferase-like glycosyltransferase
MTNSADTVHAAKQASPRILAPAGRITWIELSVLGGFCAFLFFFGLASFGLVGADEPRYAQIAREMLARHDWVTPILYGKPWLEKPILLYWQAMLSYGVFGVSDWAARFPVACDATAMVFGIYFFVRRFWRGWQLDAALITAFCAGVIGFGRAASTDMPLATTFTLGMLAWLTWHKTGHKLWLIAFYLMMGLAVLAKGPVAVVLAAGIILAYAVLRRDGRLVLRTLWLPGIAAFLAVMLPWYIAVQAATPEFFHVFVLEHNFARFGTNMFQHKQPFWYYLAVLPLAFVPWTVLGVAAFVSALKRWRQCDDLTLPIALWVLVPLVFFSLSESKLPGYILPAIPALPLLIAAWRDRIARDGKRIGTALVVGHAAVASALLTGILLAPHFVLRLKPPGPAIGIAAGVGAIVFMLILLLVHRLGLGALRFATLIPVVLGLTFTIRFVAPTVDSLQSARPVAERIAQLAPGATTVAGFDIRRETEYGLAFYRNSPVPRYDRAEIPQSAHVLIAPQGSIGEIGTLLPGRVLVRLGGFVPQHLEIYMVSAAR